MISVNYKIKVLLVAVAYFILPHAFNIEGGWGEGLAGWGLDKYLLCQKHMSNQHNDKSIGRPP